MIPSQFISISIAVAALLWFFPAHADVRYVSGGPKLGGRLTVIDLGIIERGDYQRFVSAYQRAELDWKGSGQDTATNVMLRLNSDGGDVREAMAIGAKARSLRIWLYVHPKARCVSSCVLVLAGGIRRTVYGRVGIHRPHLALDDAVTVAQQRRNYDELERAIKLYLTQVNIPISLYDTMFRISPQDVRFLTTTELQDFGLSGDDPYYEEANMATAARQRGISKSGMLARVAAAQRCGGPIEHQLECISDALEGR